MTVAPLGLVSSPISPPGSVQEDLEALLGGLLRFPSAELLTVAAALFPAVERDGRVLRWTRHGGDIDLESVDLQEGPFPRLSIGPGMVRLSRIDAAKAARAKDRAADRLAKERAQGDLVTDTPRGTRGDVGGWSSDSRCRLLLKIASLDLAPLISGAVPPVMVTLTLPGDWLAIAPTAARAAAIFDNWTRAFSKRWGVPLATIWKREFQRRGAPHWHLWLVPPTADPREFREWVSSSWVAACKTLDVLGADEAAKHLAAGTGVDAAEGMRARDPKRLALYFLKESLGGEGKAYQNEPPAEWAGQSVGRYWGVRGIAEAVATVPLDPGNAHRVWRALRRLRESNGGMRTVLVPRGTNSAGEVRYRRVKRRLRVRQGAGWVAVNDGATSGAALARYAAQLGSTC